MSLSLNSSYSLSHWSNLYYFHSETLYGVHLKSVEKQLKDLFRMCHDLQLTYLMILERHFIFDLADFEEVTILLEGMSNGYNAELGLDLLYYIFFTNKTLCKI